MIFKNCAPFTSCITEINNTQVDNAEDTDMVISMSNLTEYRNVYSKTSGGLFQCYRDELATETNDNTIDFPADNNNSNSFKFKQQITGKTGNGGTKRYQNNGSIKMSK